ncbi:unnamed protein product [Protopolystoma xenopodis]|uniref:Uncharacterized protein n=1 Tax=Protopolystoma xenopodis TaxID=117903 RepID=A0A3S5A249_9PLAT|nr:unnamed protein product [Protopolystoma xenopodis]
MPAITKLNAKADPLLHGSQSSRYRSITPGPESNRLCSDFVFSDRHQNSLPTAGALKLHHLSTDELPKSRNDPLKCEPAYSRIDGDSVCLQNGKQNFSYSDANTKTGLSCGSEMRKNGSMLPTDPVVQPSFPYAHSESVVLTRPSNECINIKKLRDCAGIMPTTQPAERPIHNPTHEHANIIGETLYLCIGH